MKPIRTLACLSVLAFAAACQQSGYYDQQGYYHAYGSGSETSTAMASGGQTTTVIEHDRASNNSYNRYDDMNPSSGNPFSRPGFYDRNGYYISMEDGPNVPASMMPPRGMCRVWFPTRTTDYQPHSESCDGIMSRMPGNAYVIFGG